MEIKYFLYFLIGGFTVSLVTYFASQSRGLLAAFFANLPVITAVTFLTIYLESGQKAVVSYAEGLIIMLFPWLAYIFTIIFLTDRIGFFQSLIFGIFLYILFACLIIGIKKF
ncbi:MAG: hypothetical protein A2Y97_04645 [Nitrospirae bacterium RBG_13_39_12]|nr:MAG: hypothetical protein A2Y97_04645 [Nitrospirae bacterium RBG_13_39_12]